MWLTDLLSFQFFQNALWASLLSAIVCGIVGSYIVVRRIVFISGGITHASFGGLGLGLYLGVNPIITACLTAVLASLGIDRLSRTSKLSEDSAIAGIWALGMALGVLFMHLTPGYTTGLSSYLFGNILLVGFSDLMALLGIAILLIALFAYCYRPILYSIFDSDFAQTRGLNARAWNLALLIVSSIAMVLSIRLVGIMLLMSLLTIPQGIMLRYTSSFKCVLLGSILLNLLGNILGLIVGIQLQDIPTGVLIVLIQFIFLGLSQVLLWVLRKNKQSL